MDTRYDQSIAHPLAQRDLLDQLLATEGGEFNVFPLSFAQERLWFLEQLEPGCAWYNIPAAVRLDGLLQTAALEAGINAIVERHEALRTTFAMLSGRAVQVIQPQLSIPLAQIDLHDLDPVAREQQVQALAVAEARRPFDLQTGPLLRATLLQLGDREHVLLVTLHHIVADGWSMALFVRELSAFYHALLTHTPVALPALPIQYADYALWQREQLQGEIRDQHLAYWRQHLGGAPSGSGTPAPSLLNLPVDRPRPAAPSYRGAQQPLRIDRTLTTSLQRLSQQHDATLFMTLLAAYATLLQRLSQQPELVIGTPIAGRTVSETEALIGCFLNTLALRLDLHDTPTFAELLAQVRRVTLGAYDHQDLPFEQVVEALQVARTTSHTPVFQVLFILQNTPPLDLTLEGVTLTPMPLDSGTAKFDLTLSLTESAAGLSGWFEYNTDLFEAATIARFAGYFQTLLAAIVVAPERSVATLPLLEDAERRHILQTWNATAQPYQHAACIHDLIAAQAARTPDAVALVYGHTSLTYAELDQQANQLAHYLQTLHVGPEVRVGVCLTRSSRLVVALLAILKAGGCYVPLDPAYPGARLQFMLRDSQAALLLTETELRECVPGAAVPAICLDQLDAELAQQPASAPPSPVSATNLGYVIYTSGSTGQPKGVAITHRNVVALIAWAQGVFTREELAGVLAATSICFDLSIFEMFLPLTVGGTVIVAENVLALPQLPARGSVTLINTVPSAIAALLREGGLPASVCTVNLAGEPLPGTLVAQLYQPPQIRRVYNLYGPTEDTTYSTWTLVPPGTATPSIGRPIANTQAYVLDALLAPVPIGVVGEVYLSGDGLARGYLGRPDLTATRFIPAPFSHDPGGRMYRTGDLGRYLPDGTIEYLGRIDHQVKIRGFRIELGEIAAVLRGVAGIDDAVVIATTGPGDLPQLVAYVAGTATPPPTVEALRQALKVHLPEYMIPAAILVLERLPLTPNGKLDRTALPTPQLVDHATARYVAPGSTLEQTLATLWAELLGQPQVGIHDDFFALGGHSLLATQMVSHIRELFDVEVPLRRVFDTPTIAGLAAVIAERQPHTQAPRIQPSAHTLTDPAPLAFAQERLWLLEQLDPGNAAYHMSAAVRLAGKLDVAALEASLQAIVARQAALRTTLRLTGGGPEQVVQPTLTLALPTHDLRPVSPEQQSTVVQQIAQAEAQQPFDLATGPLVRVRLLQLAETDHVLLVTLHHLVADGWSIGVLLHELAAYYTATLSGRAASLPELPIAYVDYARWQRAWFTGEVREQQLRYWREQLHGAPILQLPTDFPRPPVQRTEGASFGRSLPAGLTAALTALSQREGVTLFMTLLAAFDLLLARHSGQEDLLVGTPIANRNRAETEGLIGCFINTLVLRGDLTGDPTFRVLLQRVRQVTLAAYDHQDLPFEQLVDALQPTRDPSRNPLFDVMINFINTPRIALELPHLSLSYLDLIEPESKLALTLYIEEVDHTLDLRFVYQCSLFAEQRIACFADQFQHLLEQIVADSTRPISAYSLVTPAGRVLLPDPVIDLPAPDYEPITATFTTWAGQTPEQPAVCQGGQSWSYRELAESSQAIAQALVRSGLQRGQTVAVCGRRSFGLISGLLGVLSSGGVLLTIDTRLPLQRRQMMLAAADVAYALSVGGESSEDDAWLRAAGALVIDVDARTGQVGGAQADDLQSLLPALTPGDAAYIFFTSGTTGVPKGVLGWHGGLSHFLHWQRQTFGIEPRDRSAQLTGLSFDVVLRDIFLPLTSGATLCLPDPDQDLAAHHVLPWLERERISLLHTVPALARSWLATVPAGATLGSLRWVFFAGEPLTDTLVQRWRAAFPAAALVNLYGPTETTLAKCFFQVPAPALPGVQPVGQPLPHTQALVLGVNDQLCGIGEPGEIVIRTPFRSRGYINAAEEQRSRFVPNHFRADDQDLLYRTGDRGRYRLDGMLEILGRFDHQVKLRGMRVELSEVEAALAQHPLVQAVAVIACEDRVGEVLLAAYVVPSAAAPLQVQELQAFLKEQLPAHMIPAAIMLLERLPLTPNGKLDRTALPAPQPVDHATVGYVAPGSALEQTLATLWAELLGQAQVGIHDDFFALGGHSLLATQVVSWIYERYQIEVPLRRVFETPTIAGLAAVIAERQPHTQAPRIQPSAHALTDPAPLAFAQERLWLLEQLDPGSPTYHMPASLRLTGRLDVAALQASLQAIVARQAALRTTLRLTNGVPAQVVQPTLPLVVPTHDLRQLPPEQQSTVVQQIAQAEAQQPFDLAAGPLVRVRLLQLAETDHVLLVTLHHLVADGWSIGVLLHELAAHYRSYVTGTPARLPDLPIAYVDYARWQRAWFAGEVREQQLRYWREQLRGASTLQLPTDFPRPPVQGRAGGTVQRMLSAQLAAALTTLSQREGVTLFMTLLAAFDLLLAHYANQDDISIGTAIANRNRAETEGLIGCFINTLVLRSDLTGDPTFRVLLQLVRQTTLAAYDHQDLPFEQLVDALQPTRDPSRNPLFQVAFVLQNMSIQPVELPDLVLTPANIGASTGTARFDLLLALSETAQGLIAGIEYSADLFKAGTMQQMLDHYTLILQSIVGRPEIRLGELRALLSETDRQQQIGKQAALKEARTRQLKSLQRKPLRADAE